MMLAYLKNIFPLIKTTNKIMSLFLRILFIYSSLFSSLSVAATLTSVSVEKHKERYILHIEAQVDAESNRVKQVVTDYNNLKSINLSLKESNIISVENKLTTVSMLTDTCVLFVCYKIRHVQVFRHLGEDIIFGRIIPRMSDFKQGWTRWTIKHDKSETEKNVTTLILDTEMTPDFFIVPIIGTHHVKNKILEIAEDTINNLEKEAQKKLNNITGYPPLPVSSAQIPLLRRHTGECQHPVNSILHTAHANQDSLLLCSTLFSRF